MAIDKRELDMVDGRAKPTGNHRTARCWVPRLPRPGARTEPARTDARSGPEPGPARATQPARIGHLSVLDAPRPGAHEAHETPRTNARHAIDRSTLLKRAAVGLGGISAGGAAAAGFAQASGQQTSAADHLSPRDKEVLQFALKLEHLQTAFYREALQKNKLTGEAKQFAQVVGHEEDEHLAYLEHELGSAANPSPKFNFGDATTNDKRFIAAAVTFEDLTLAAYNGQAENMSRQTLKSVSRVISVEARHAAWSRSLAGKLPAPVPADVPITADAALKAIHPYMA